MNLPRPEIFISAATRDLGPTRALLERAVLDLGAHPVVQAHFAPAGQTVAGMLREKIASSHAVIHVVGQCYGFEDATLPAAREHWSYAQGRRSYTQLEHDLALELKKPLYLFLCDETFPYDPHDPESEQYQQLQRDHRARLLSGNHLYTLVKFPDELRKHILRLEERIKLLARRIRQSERHLGRTMIVGGAAIVLLAGGGWWLKERVFRAEDTVKKVEKNVTDELALNRETVRLLVARYNDLGDPKEQLTDEEKLQRALARVAEQEKISVGELRARVDTFIAQVRAREALGKADFYDLGLAAFAEKNFQKATEFAVKASEAADVKVATGEDLARQGAALVAQGQELIAQGREDKRNAETLAGDAELAAIHYPQAVEHYRAAAALYDRPTETFPWVDVQAKLGGALWCNGQYRDSAAVWQEVLAEMEHHLSPEDPRVLSAFNNLALSRQYSGDYATAERLFRRALEMRERVSGREHPETLGSVNNLALLLTAKGDYAGAEPLYRRALEVGERVLGEEHPNTLTSMNCLAELLRAKGDDATAEPLYRRALAARERVLGAEHPSTLTSVNNLALLLMDKGDDAAAEPLLRRALAARKRVLGAEHPDTLGSVNNLGLWLRAKGDYAAAEALYRRALDGRERVLGPEHPDTLISVNNLAFLLDNKGDYTTAEPLFRRALAVRERVLGVENPDTSLSALNLAFFLMKHGRKPEAVPLAWQAYRGWSKSKGAKHEDTRDARELLLKLGETVPEEP